MISDKILRGLVEGKKYLIYDSIYEYTLHKRDGYYFIQLFGSITSNSLTVWEKDLEDLLIDSDYEATRFYKNVYKYQGYTKRYRATTSVGFIYVHGYFSWADLKFYSELKNEEDIVNLRKFKKVMDSCNRKTSKK